jgi:putative tryptophan/tyrosine transport system substrate-binding protein
VIRRREFISLIGSAAAAWPVAARAQQSERMRRIGVLMHSRADEPEAQARLRAFLQGLEEAGWAVGRNLQVDHRWSVGDLARLRKDAAELVALTPDAILAGVGATTPSLLQASQSVPIVFAQGIDPVGNGYVESMAQPGGNATGFIQFEYIAWPENGWSYSKSLRLESRASPFCANPATPESVNGPSSKRWHSLWALN